MDSRTILFGNQAGRVSGATTNVEHPAGRIQLAQVQQRVRGVLPSQVNAWQCVRELADEIVPLAGAHWFLAGLVFLYHNLPSVRCILKTQTAQRAEVHLARLDRKPVLFSYASRPAPARRRKGSEGSRQPPSPPTRMSRLWKRHQARAAKTTATASRPASHAPFSPWKASRA